MKPLLFLSQRIPYPPNRGDKLRSFAVLRHLAKSWDIHLGCFIDDPADWQSMADLRPYCADLRCVGLDKRWAKLRSLSGLVAGTSLSEPYFRDARMSKWVNTVLRDVQPSTAFLFSSVMGQYVLPAGPNRPHRLVMDFVDVDSDKWRQYAAMRFWPMSWVYRRESRRLLEFDRDIARRADAAVFVSPPEAALFRHLAPEAAAKTTSISCGVDFAYFSADHDLPNPFQSGSKAVVFTGAMDYWPNVDAVTWFAESILPSVRKAMPEAVFFIVGGNPTAKVQRLGALPGVFITGRVPDVRPYLAHAAVAVAPMRVARGIQNKVLEAMSMGRVTVTTDHGLEGIDALPGRDLLVANDATTFASTVVKVLADPALAPIGEAARGRVVSNYSWDDKLAAFDRLLQGD
jgi:sugar transferase (PEP-CTERM/EpsH1 system associated)